MHYIIAHIFHTTICMCDPKSPSNSLRPRRNGRYNPDDIFKRIFLKENVWIPIMISLKFVPKGPINNIPALVQVMAWRRPGDKLLSEPMMASLLTHICVTRPQWVKAVGEVSLQVLLFWPSLSFNMPSLKLAIHCFFIMVPARYMRLWDDMSYFDRWSRARFHLHTCESTYSGVTSISWRLESPVTLPFLQQLGQHESKRNPPVTDGFP